MTARTPRNWFQYLMKLHYSQTTTHVAEVTAKFQYLMKLHYSQTVEAVNDDTN